MVMQMKSVRREIIIQSMANGTLYVEELRQLRAHVEKGFSFTSFFQESIKKILVLRAFH